MRARALSSGGERFLDTEEVGGSNPPAPTTKRAGQAPILGVIGRAQLIRKHDTFTEPLHARLEVQSPMRTSGARAGKGALHS